MSFLIRRSRNPVALSLSHHTEPLPRSLPFPENPTVIWFVSVIAYLAVCIVAAVGVNMWLEGKESERFRMTHLLGILFWPVAAVYLVYTITVKRLPR